MPQTMVNRGNVLYDFLMQPFITWASVGANTTAEQNVTIPGLVPNDYVDIRRQDGVQTTGIAQVNVRVIAANTLTVQWVNSTGGALTPAAGLYLCNVTRAESVPNLPPNAN